MAVRAAQGDENRSELLLYCAEWTRLPARGRYRSGEVEAVKEYDPGHVRERISVRRGPQREAVARNGALLRFTCPPLPRPEAQQ